MKQFHITSSLVDSDSSTLHYCNVCTCSLPDWLAYCFASSTVGQVEFSPITFKTDLKSIGADLQKNSEGARWSRRRGGGVSCPLPNWLSSPVGSGAKPQLLMVFLFLWCNEIHSRTQTKLLCINLSSIIGMLVAVWAPVPKYWEGALAPWAPEGCRLC